MSDDNYTVYKVNYDKIESIEDIKAVLKLFDLTIGIKKENLPPKSFWDAIEKELLIEVKPIQDE